MQTIHKKIFNCNLYKSVACNLHTAGSKQFLKIYIFVCPNFNMYSQGV